MNNNQQENPLLEPVSGGASNFFLLPKGYQLFKVHSLEVDQGYISKRGNKPGWNFKFYFKVIGFAGKLEESENEYRCFQNTCSDFGKSLLTTFLEHSGVEHTIPNPNDLTSAGTPRKSFRNALFSFDNITNEWVLKEEGIVGKYIFLKVFHKKKCGGCGWYVTNEVTCFNCQHDNTEKRFYATIDLIDCLPATQQQIDAALAKDKAPAQAAPEPQAPVQEAPAPAPTQVPEESPPTTPEVPPVDDDLPF